MAKKGPPPIDSRSDAVVLFYTGGPVSSDVPTRDLSGGDLFRLAYSRAIRAADGLARPSLELDLQALADELVALGAFLPEAPAAPAEPEA